MGEVYRARDTRLNREVAVKILPVSFANNPDRLLRFEQEARATSALNRHWKDGVLEGTPSSLIRVGSRLNGSSGWKQNSLADSHNVRGCDTAVTIFDTVLKV